MQPEIEKRGYAVAKNARSADFLVYINYPIDPLVVSRIAFVRAEPTVPFQRENETESERRRREYQKATAEMVREPK